MRIRNMSYIFVGAAIACALSWPLPATADDSAQARSNGPSLVVPGGRLLSAEEMSNVRGAYTSVTIRINGVVYTASNPSNPSSSSLNIPLGPGSYSRASATTTGTGGSLTRSTSTVTITGVTVKTSP